MNSSSLVWGSPAWSWAALALAGAGVLAVVWSYWRARSTTGVKLAAASLKAIAMAGLALCLIEPLLTSTRARPGANIFAVVADNSQSMSIHDRDAATSRGSHAQQLLDDQAGWQKRLADDFDARRFAFDSHLRSINTFAELKFDGSRSSLNSALNSLSRRFRGLPLAGALLVTDGNTTDAGEVEWASLPPIYPIVLGRAQPPADISIASVTVSQTNFETAPVTVRADVRATGIEGRQITASLVDQSGKAVQTQTLEFTDGDEPLSVRFQLRPQRGDVSFYRVRVAAKQNPQAAEATLANNEWQVMVDRGGGPYRVLYVCGRPNWEFKFLRRALEADDQIELDALVRIARREPKFTFRSRAGESTNPLFRGFEHPDEETAEHYDQPVLIRLGMKDENELREGFPKTAEELYRYDAVILDDVESEFFSQDQLTLLEGFVSRRGGGLLMLGGPDSLAAGRYDRTPVGHLLPVYVDKLGQSKPADVEHQYRLALTREGWLQPWVRTRQTEPEERKRLASMPTFRSLSPVDRIKPAATILAEVLDETGAVHPALVTQRFGRGRSAALLIGDFWRWALRRETDKQSDLEKSWRQTVRWLVADVPRRVEVEVDPRDESETGAVSLSIRVRDAQYLPLDNAQVTVEVTTPDGKKIALDAQPHEEEPGAYQATHAPREPGAYRAAVKVNGPDGSPIGERAAGWVAQPAADEFRSLQPDRALLAEIAQKTGGEIVEPEDIDRLIASLPTRKVPITEPWIRPAWHHPLFYLAIIGCLVTEWGLRRWKGLA